MYENRFSTRNPVVILLMAVAASVSWAQVQIKTPTGTLEGIVDMDSGIRIFKRIPFARPPVGDLRWQPPQPANPWDGVKPAKEFGPRAMQLPIFGDMKFRSDGMSEDCLYLNVWTPAQSDTEKLPVLVYFYGGGFIAGDGSEGRYDGHSMATKGIVSVTVNYRLGLFGFFAHPELTKESKHKASGNYGLLDQYAALKWVYENIAAFGGDPRRITIAGESAGSISVSAQMASPLSKGMIAGAIGESGSIIGTLPALPLAAAEAKGVDFATKLGDGKQLILAELRKIPADELLQRASRANFVWFNPTVDGYFLPKPPVEIYTAGEQAKVPLLAGVNSEESGYNGILGQDAPTVENFRKALQRLYPGQADRLFKVYPATNESEVKLAARDLAGDRFISHGTWKWIDLATQTSGKPTYYYLFAKPRPLAQGAVHSAEIEYALGNLALNVVYAWTTEDRQVSKLMQDYFANFIITGNPNGADLPAWPEFSTGKRLVIDVNTKTENTAFLRARYDLLDQLSSQQ